MGTFPPQHPPMNEITPQQYSDPHRFSSMAGFTRSLDSSEGESPEYSPSRTPECNEKPVKRRASRAGTRSVSTLTPAQLSRKRANDREAQRAIRQRTKEHIEKLELRIAELEASFDNSSNTKFDNVLLRNAVLERQIIELARQLQMNCNPFDYNTTKQYDPSEITTLSQWQTNNFGPATDSLTSCDNGYFNSGITASTYSPTSMHMPLTPDGNPPFLDTTVGNGICTPSDIGSPCDWHSMGSPVDHTSSITSRPSIPRSVPNFPVSPVSTQSTVYRQPAMFSWEIPTKLTSATNPVDSLLLTLISTQRAMAMNGMPRSQAIGSSHPNLKALIYDDPETQSSTHPTSKILSDILRNTPMFNLPERAAAFFVMYYFVQWQISPSPETYNNVPEWFQPRPSQHVTPHAMWVDLVPFSRLRDRIIDNQDAYETDEFQEAFTTSLNLNWPYRDLDVLEVVDEGGLGGSEVRVSEQFKRHLLNLNNWSLDSTFARRYPELADACNFTEGGGKERRSATGESAESLLMSTSSSALVR